MSTNVMRDPATTGTQHMMDESRHSEEGGAIGSTKTGEDEGNKFQQAIAAWRNLNLTTLVSSLDKSAAELVEHQKDTVAQRKELAQKTKDFRKMDDTGKLAEIKGLLKMYQNFIDVLTNQSKAVNSAFLSAYTPLSEAPDPYPLLEASVESLVTSEELVPRLESENKHLQKNVAKLTTQLEETEEQLERERKSRQTSESSQGGKIKEVERSWEAVLKEKEENWSVRQKSLEEKVENQERLLKELKASYEVSQRLEKASGEDYDNAARKAASAEMEILNSELEKVTLRLSEMESRNEQLRLELAQSKSGTAQKASLEDDPAFLRLRSENSSLLRKLESAKYERGSEQSKLESRIKALEREMSSAVEDREGLKKKLEKFSDYDEIKQELEMIRAIEFATGDDEDATAGDEESGLTNGQNRSKTESLEQLLLSRNKKLSNELTELRISHKSLESQLSSLQETLSTTNMDLEKTRQLNAQLENDLTEAQHHVSNFDTASLAGTYTSRYPRSSYAPSRRGLGSTSPTSSIISGFDGGGRSSPATNRDGPNTSASSSGGGTSSSILPMITAQRDRFKTKLQALETELSKSHATISSLRGEIASLQRDNLSLYEKSRYVSTYSSSTGPRPTVAGNTTTTSSSSSIYPTDRLPSGTGSGGGGGGLDRYRSAYESGLTPLTAFRGRESRRALRRMTAPERGVLALARTVLATRARRAAVAMYLVLLHGLVLVTLLGGTTAGAAGAAFAGAGGEGGLVVGPSLGQGGAGEGWERERAPGG